jgi:fused signal recognition particle receptor
MSPEDRLENVLGYSPKEIEELKKSGKFEDTLKAERLDDEFLESKRKKYSDEFSGYANELEEYEKELRKDEKFQNKIQNKISDEENEIRDYYENLKKRTYDNLDAKKNYDAEQDSRTQFVERKIRELAEKDPEVKRKLAQYDEAMARRKQKLEKRKANKAEARAREQEARRAQEYTEYYLDDIEISW